MVAFLIFLCIMSFLLVLVVYGTLARNRWGINFEPARCSVCGNAAFSAIRRPASLRQALWGGKTCPICGTEMDKWGRQISSSPK